MDDDQRGYTGFPSPAEEYRLPSLNIQSLLVPRARTTFYVRFEGDAMEGLSIHDQDLLIVERVLAYDHGQIVMAFVAGQRLVRRLERRGASLYLCPANSIYKEIEMGEDAQIFGRVTHSITHHLRIKQHLPTAS